MQIPTVRVVSEAAPGGFMLINAVDYVDGVHELCAGEVAPVRAKPLSADGGEAEITARLVGKLMAHKAAISLADWLALSSAERVEKMCEAETDFDAVTATSVAVGDEEAPAERVAKGPRGKWYGWRGKERLTAAFDTAEAAQAAIRNVEA